MQRYHILRIRMSQEVHDELEDMARKLGCLSVTEVLQRAVVLQRHMLADAPRQDLVVSWSPAPVDTVEDA